MVKRKDAMPVAPAEKKAKVTPGTVTSRHTCSKLTSPLVELGKHANRVLFNLIPEDELAGFEGKGAWDMIIDKHVVIKSPGRHLPRIPLCRLLPMEAVRPLQDDDVQRMKKEFMESGYIESHPAFYLCISNKDGERAHVKDFSTNWDPIWRKLNEDFERECEAVEEFHVLKDKMFWVFDGNHRLTAWSAVAAEFPDRRSHHPCVRFILLDPSQSEFVLVEQAMQKLNS